MTDSSTDTAGRQDRFGKLIERADGADVPFYDDRPVHVAGWKWLVIVLAAVAGFLALVLIPATGNLRCSAPGSCSSPSPRSPSSRSPGVPGRRSSGRSGARTC